MSVRSFPCVSLIHPMNHCKVRLEASAPVVSSKQDGIRQEAAGEAMRWEATIFWIYSSLSV